MGSFAASLRTLDDNPAVKATVRLDDGRLSIALGNESIGDWALDEIDLEQIDTGYRMAAEGDQIIIEIDNIEAFQTELDEASKRRRPSLGRFRRERKPPPTEVEPTPDRIEAPTRTSRTAADAPVSPPDQDQETGERPGFGERLVAMMDAGIERAEKRWGSLLPKWVFSRPVLVGLILMLITSLIFPATASVILLVGGLLLVVLGAVFYTDPMLVAKWLPGRMQPVHVLVSGVSILLFGVLVGMLAG